MHSSWKVRAARAVRGAVFVSSTLVAVGCGGDKGGVSSGSPSASVAVSVAESAPSTSAVGSGATTPASASTAAASTPAKASGAPVASAPIAAGEPAEVNVDQLFKDEPTDSSGLVVEPDKVQDRAPGLTGLNISQQTKDKAEWLPLANLQIFNPGWAKRKEGEVGIVYSEPLHAGVAFAPFDAKANGGQRVDQLTKALGWTNIQWVKKPKALRLGEDKSVPATMFFGRAKSAKGDPLKVFFAILKTGKPVNVVAVGGARAASPPEAINTALGIVALVKKNPG